jgi:hypothetical protein
MRRGWLFFSLPALLAAGPATFDPVAGLAGRFSSHFRNGLIGGSDYWSDNVVEVVPVDARHAYVSFDLQFYNGHSCSLAGVAKAEGDALVYRGPPDDTFLGDSPCRLVVRRHHGQLTWNDDGTCKAHCGARGSFLTDGLPWSSKRRITYLPRLKRSSDYRDALFAWRRQVAQ